MLRLLVLLAACAAPPRAPEPTVEVGTVTYTLVDRARMDPVVPTKPRAWIVQLYYPSERTPLHDHYADDRVLVAALVAEQYYGATPAELNGWLAKPAFAETGARPKAHGKWPVITLSPGLAFARLNYAELATHLVARGYVVAVIDHPYLGISHVGDAIVSADADPMLQSENPADSLPRVREWTRDISVVLDDLAATPHVPGLALDLDHVIATGHSIGGTAAIGACDDARVRGCVDFEGFVDGVDSLAHGAQKPILMAFSRAKGRPATLAPGAVDPMDALRTQLAARGQPVWIAKITGGSHTSFSDSPDVLPRTLSRFGGELMTPARSFDVYTSLVDAFARGVLESTLSRLPEVAAHQ
jgi:dienelactone hydrolase